MHFSSTIGSGQHQRRRSIPGGWGSARERSGVHVSPDHDDTNAEVPAADQGKFQVRAELNRLTRSLCWQTVIGHGVPVTAPTKVPTVDLASTYVCKLVHDCPHEWLNPQSWRPESNTSNHSAAFQLRSACQQSRRFWFSWTTMSCSDPKSNPDPTGGVFGARMWHGRVFWGKRSLKLHVSRSA